MNFISEITEGLGIAFNAIRANKMRSVLTTLGIVIGIVSVTLMATAIEGVDRKFEESASAFGADVLYIQKFPWVGHGDWWTYRNRKDITVDIADDIERQATLVEAVAPSVVTVRPAQFGDRVVTNAFLTGTTNQYVNTSGTSLKDGRFFSQEESNGGRPVCVVGANIAENLFPNEDPIGKMIKVGSKPYRIQGVFEKQGGLFGIFTSDNRVFIPIKSFMSSFGSRRDITIQVKASSMADIEDVKEELRGIVRKSRMLKPSQADDFNINQQELLTETFGAITAVIAAVGFFITGLALFVGGIGIMNIMFVSVTERTKEIGIRKAIGAKRRTILLQFLIESSIICLFGGLLGLIVAYPLSLIANQILPTAMPLEVVAIAIIISLLVGVISGFLPAYRASRLNPVDALRYE
ncbi:MAG: ABC transporter permease [Bacteroidetes bacterium]|nr:ABC transporter permease [Bacteroidota bacterium]MBU2472288.1 ABC transporter permease [Bacteroidota bacterium]